jgi:repressor LexA
MPSRSTPKQPASRLHGPARSPIRGQVLAFVRERLATGSPPTVREVQQAFGFKAVQSARQHLEALVAEGRLTKEPGRSRGYRLPALGGPAPSIRLVPRLGRVQAGALREAIEDPDHWDPEGWLAVERSTPGEELFALTVRGESMTGAGILPGDTVIVRRQDTARDGEIVVALVREEATVKRLRLRDGRLELWPENPAFAPLVFAPIAFAPDAEIRILGRVVEVRRRLT